jgi:hypothetical protein
VISDDTLRLPVVTASPPKWGPVRILLAVALFSLATWALAATAFSAQSPVTPTSTYSPAGHGLPAAPVHR